MASGSKGTGKGRNSGSRSGSRNKRKPTGSREYSKRNKYTQDALDDGVRDEIYLIILLAVCVFLFLCMSHGRYLHAFFLILPTVSAAAGIIT